MDATQSLLLALFCLVATVSSEAFSSTAHLKMLSGAGEEASLMLDQYVQEEEQRLQQLKQLIPTIAHFSTTSASHPVNAYHLIKRWYQLNQFAPNLATSPVFQQFVVDHALQMPSEMDFVGSAAALLRLQRTYSLPTESLARGEVFGELSDMPMQSDDCYLLGDTAMKNNDYGLAAQWFDMSVRDVHHDQSVADNYLQLARAHRAIGDLTAAVTAAEISAQLDPSNSTVQADYWNYKNQVDQVSDTGYARQSLNMSTWERFLPDWKSNYEMLCRGDASVTRSPSVLSTLTCRYKAGRLPYVRYREETLSWSPRISMFYDVISDTEADHIKQMATPMLYRAVVGDPAKAYATNERVSKVAWLWDTNSQYDGMIQRLSARVSDVTGLETEYRAEYSSSEPFQVVNYGIGGQYEPHVDFYEDKQMLESVPYFIRQTGDRLTTFLFYLSEIMHGGATVFPLVGVRVPAVKNAAAFWYNAKPSGEFDGNTQHAGCPVLLGEKWVANKWIREYGQEFRRPCALHPEAVWDV